MTNQYKADLAILSITIMWGASFTLMKSVLDFLPVYAYLSLRFLIAGIILIILFNKHLKKVNKKSLIGGSIVGLMLFGGMAFQVTGLKYTTASNSAFITGLNVILVPIISATFLKKKPPLSAIIGVMLAGIGLFFLSGGIKFDFNFGDLLTFFCAICFALQIILIDKFVEDSDARIIALIQICSASILYSIIWLGFERQSFEVNLRVIITILFTGAFGTAFAFGVQTVAQKYTTPTRAALIITCEPVFGAIFAVTLPDSNGNTEVLGILTIAGCALILIGMFITELVPQIKKKSKMKKKLSMEL